MKKPPKLGSVNACGIAFIYDKNGKEIGHCFDTPNSKAFAFKQFKDVHSIKSTDFPTMFRQDAEKRFCGLEQNLISSIKMHK